MYLSIVKYFCDLNVIGFIPPQLKQEHGVLYRSSLFILLLKYKTDAFNFRKVFFRTPLENSRSTHQFHFPETRMRVPLCLLDG